MDIVGPRTQGMQAFTWDQRYFTGIEIVDQQHRHLVDIVNAVGELLLSGDRMTEGKLQILFKQLADYARQHFADEEQLMRAADLDPRHLKPHAEHHRQFVHQVASMWRARGSMGNPAETVHGFLTAWLTFHILGEDQVMARQIARIEAGESPQMAYEIESQTGDSSSAALLGALHRLYSLLSIQNQDLAMANERLEEKVAARTRELTEANRRLEAEQQASGAPGESAAGAREQLCQAERAAALGQLAAGMALEINAPVGFVNANLSTLKAYLERLLAVLAAYEHCESGAGDGREALAAAKAAVDLDYLREDALALMLSSQEGLARIRKIVDDLKSFSHTDPADWQTTDLHGGIDTILNLVWSELRGDLQLVREYGSVPPVRCLPSLVNQAFLNLLVNAAQAIAGTGTVTVRTGADRDQAWIEVQDTGSGMSPELRERAFEPRFSTRPDSPTAGLGLALAYDIVVKRHGGDLLVASEPGRGTTFRMLLPISGATA